MSLEWGVCDPPPLDYLHTAAGKNAVHIRTYTYSACCVLQAAAKDMSRCLSLRCGIALFFFRALLGDKHFPLLWQQRVDRRGVGIAHWATYLVTI